MTTENQFRKIINFWVKDKDYELIPIINMLNDKMDEIEKVFKY